MQFGSIKLIDKDGHLVFIEPETGGGCSRADWGNLIDSGLASGRSGRRIADRRRFRGPEMRGRASRKPARGQSTYK